MPKLGVTADAWSVSRGARRVHATALQKLELIAQPRALGSLPGRGLAEDALISLKAKRIPQ